MYFLDELPYMRLFSQNKKVYIPIDPSNKRKGSAIMLLTENPVDSMRLMELPYMYNPRLFTGLYIDRNVNAYINSGAIIDDEENEPVNEAMVHSVKAKDIEIELHVETPSSNDFRILKGFFKEDVFMKWYKALNTPNRYIPEKIYVYAYPSVKEMANGANKVALKNKEVAVNSYSTFDTIYVVAPSGYDKIKKAEGEYEAYLTNEVITQACMNTSKRCSRFMACNIGTALSGQITDKLVNKIENDWGEVKDDKIAVAYAIKRMYDKEGMRPIRDMVKHGDFGPLIGYAGRSFIRKISGIYEATLSAADRKAISDKDYGLPGQRKYPMPDESHVRSAIRFFNHVDSSDEAELARNINKKIKQYDLDVNVGKDNRFSKYYKNGSDKSAKSDSKKKSKNENAIHEDSKRMRRINDKDVSKVYGKYNKDKGGRYKRDKEEGALSFNSGNVDVAMANSNPELFNTAKLVQMLSCESVVDIYNNFVGMNFVKLTEEYNDIIIKAKKKAEEEGDSGSLFKTAKAIMESQAEMNTIVKLMAKDYIYLGSIPGMNDDEASMALSKKWFPDGLTEEGCRKLINLRINKNRFISATLRNMLQLNYNALGLTNEEAKALISELGSDETNAEAMGKIKDILKNPEILKNFRMGPNNYNFKSIGGGYVFLSGDEDIQFSSHPSKNLVNIFTYDAIVTAHGGFIDPSEARIDRAKDEYKLKKDIVSKLENFLKGYKEFIEKIKDGDNKNEFIARYARSIEDKELLSHPSISDELRQEYGKALISSFSDPNGGNKVKEIHDKMLQAYAKSITDTINSRIDEIIKTISRCAELSEAFLKDTKNINNEIVKEMYDKFGVFDDETPEIQYIRSVNSDIAFSLVFIHLDLKDYITRRSFISDDKKKYIDSKEKKVWTIQPVDTLKKKNITNTIELLRQLKAEGFKNVLLTSCNPGNVQLPDDIKNDPNFKVTYGSTSVYKEATVYDSSDEVESQLNIIETYLDDVAARNNIVINEATTLQDLFEEYDDLCNGIGNGVLNEGLIDIIKAIASKAVEIVVKLWRTLVNFFRAVWKKIKEFFVGKPTEKVKDKETKKAIEVAVIEVNNSKASVKKIAAKTAAEAQKAISDAAQKISKTIDATSKEETSSIEYIKSNASKVKPNGNKSGDQSEKQESAMLEAGLSFDKPSDLSDWMKHNIKYKQYTSLMSADEVYSQKQGSCHDQVVFELKMLKMIPKCSNCKAWFVFEHDGKGQGGETHSYVTYKDGNRLYWFENAWGPKAGIHPIKDNKEFIRMHNSGEWGNKSKYPEIELVPFKASEGMSLQQLVDSCLNESTNNLYDCTISSEINPQILYEFDWEPDDEIKKSKVYFTKRITPDSLVEIFNALGVEMGEKTAVKISTGEPGKGPRYCLNPQLIQKLVNSVDGTIVECNVAYEGPRHTSEEHWKTIKKHGYYDIAPCDILDEDGDYPIPVENGLVLDHVLGGNHMKNYDSFIILSHFKGHTMGGYGGALKNVAIGLSSADGKKIVHSGGHMTASIAGMTPDGGMDSADKPVHDLFLRSMADANKAFGKEMGDKVVYINVANNISVDCDCDPEPHAPTMRDLGIFASTDPVAVDQAAIDAVYAAPDSDDVIHRIEERHGLRTIEYALELGLGNRDYDLIDIDEESNKPKVNISVNREAVLNEVKFINDKGEKVPKLCPKCGAKVGVFLKGEPVFLCSNKECNKYFGTVPFDESVLYENDGGNKLMTLDKFISVPLNKHNARFFSDQSKGLANMEINDNCKGKIFIENKDGERRVVGYYNLETRENNEVWLQAIEVMPNYQNQGIGTLLIRDAVQNGAKYLAVKKTNTVAKSMYIKHGFKRFDTTDTMVMMVRESVQTRIPLPVKAITESMNDNGYVCTDDYIMDENSITFFNGMDSQVISEAEKSYDAKLKKYLFQERMKNNKAVIMRYQEMKAMCPWITKTFVKLPMYRGYNIFIDLSYYHGLFLKHLQFKKDRAIDMYWDFINRLISSSEYKDIYKKITIFIPVYPGAWDVDDPVALMDYKVSINPISLIIRTLRKNPNRLKAWGNKDIVFVSPKGFFKVNFSTFNIKDLAKFKRFIGKLATYEEIAEDDAEDGYSSSNKETDSSAAITAKIVDKIEKNTGVQIDDITGDGMTNATTNVDDTNVLTDKKIHVAHLRIRTGELPLPRPVLNKDREGYENPNTILIMAPNDDSAVDTIKNSIIKSAFFSNNAFYTP